MQYSTETSKSKGLDFNNQGRYGDIMDYDHLHSAKVEDRAVKALVKYNKQVIKDKEINKKLLPVVARTRTKNIDMKLTDSSTLGRYQEKLVSYNNRYYMLYDDEHINEDEDNTFVVFNYTNQTQRMSPFSERITYGNLDESIGVSKNISQKVKSYDKGLI